MGQTWTLPLAGGATASGFSLDDLTVALLVGSLVLVVAVLRLVRPRAAQVATEA